MQKEAKIVGRKRLFASKPVFNPNVLYRGVAVRIDGKTFDGDSIYGNFIVFNNIGESLTVVGLNSGTDTTLRIDMEDIDSGLRIQLLEDGESEE